MSDIIKKEGNMMAKIEMVCETNQVTYISIRQAMIQGERTKEELQKSTNVCLTCEGCRAHLDWILSSACGCKNTSLKAVVDAVANGAKTVEEIGRVTGAGTEPDCGRCHKLLENVIAQGY